MAYAGAGAGVGVGCGPVAPVAPFWSNTGVILVLFILLVIISRTILGY